MDRTIQNLEKKILSGERLDFDDGVFLFQHPDLLAIGQLANFRREALHGDITYFNQNLHLNSTNVCEADCLFCSFARLEKHMPQAVTMTHAQALEWIRSRYRPGMTEIHIVNGLDPNLPFSYYTELLSNIQTHFPALHIKAFTAVEIHYFSKKYNLSYQEVLQSFIDSGLGSLPGGGAEIFAHRVRKKICPDKATAEEWLRVHQVAHTMGLKSNCTMLYGTIEHVEERVDHLLRLRELQDQTGGFQAFIPLSYHPENNRLGRLPAPTGADDLRMIALSRLILDNIPHVKAYWIMLGIKTAQLAQRFGANDLDGTVVEEKIYHMAGARTPDMLTVEELKRLIKAVGREPVERTTTYEVIDEMKLPAQALMG